VKRIGEPERLKKHGTNPCERTIDPEEVQKPPALLYQTLKSFDLARTKVFRVADRYSSAPDL
jgi:hypothetical protein